MKVKSANCFIFCTFFIKFLHISSAELYLHTYKIECGTGNNSKYLDNVRCSVQTLGRGVTAITVLVDIVQPLNYILTWAEFSRKSPSSDTFDNAIINMTHEYCNEIKNEAILKFIMPLFNKYAPKFIHDCPYMPQKDLGIRNFVTDTNLIPSLTLKTFPRGDYRFLVQTYDRKNNLMYASKVYYRLVQKRPTTKKSG